ncbi:DUF2325 domain-containing protein [Niveibacterium sp. SC-1]|uniref:DUF2325 domain-containing protein n=1 Tax=Niveibacterium sp. SC-1 TaxID=3135646 RepID=UPI0031201011
MCEHLRPLEIFRAGSRRKRLWELPDHTHCPLVGVCMPMPVLRRLVQKVMGQVAATDDYQVHVGAVAECVRRSAMAEALQRELDRRYALAVTAFAKAKSTEALAAMWADALQGADVAGALWAVLTHARCDTVLCERVSRDIHMLQHQLGAQDRSDLSRLAALQEENAVLARELAAVQARSSRALAERIAESEATAASLMQARAQVLARDSMLALLRDELSLRDAQTPDLPDRLSLKERADTLTRRVHALERECLEWRQRAEQQRALADELAAQLAAFAQLRGDNVIEPLAVELHDKAVLCVGGRPASVPTYKHLVETTGGRFLHHDGGEEDSAARLEASLAAADLVICQTGCVSHGAYWRVKDHCKRTGKRCIFVDKPSASSLARGLRQFVAITAAPDSPREDELAG